MTDFSESEAAFQSDDPEQEGDEVDVRSAAKERRGATLPAPG